MDELTFERDCLIERISQSWWQRSGCWGVYMKSWGGNMAVFLGIIIIIYLIAIFVLLRNRNWRVRIVVTAVYAVVVGLVGKVLLGM